MGGREELSGSGAAFALWGTECFARNLSSIVKLSGGGGVVGGGRATSDVLGCEPHASLISLGGAIVTANEMLYLLHFSHYRLGGVH